MISAIPLAILSLFFTALIISYKNNFLKYIYNAIYPNIADQPFMQINVLMTNSFGNQKSNEIRSIYIYLLEKFKNHEEEFLTLLCEWYDIRENKDLSLDDKTYIINDRYQKHLHESVNIFININTQNVARNNTFRLKRNIMGIQNNKLGFFNENVSLSQFSALQREINTGFTKPF